MNKVPVTVIGVSAAGFDGAQQVGETADVSVPLAHYLLLQPDRPGRAEPGYWWLSVMARLAPGATADQARAALEPTFQAAAREGWVRPSTPRRPPRRSAAAGRAGRPGPQRDAARAAAAADAAPGPGRPGACRRLRQRVDAARRARRRPAPRLRPAAGDWRQPAQHRRAVCGRSAAGGGRGGGRGERAGVGAPRRAALAPSARQQADRRPRSAARRPCARGDRRRRRRLRARVQRAAGAAGEPHRPGHGLPGRHADPRQRRRSWLVRGLLAVQVALSLVLLVGAGLFSRTLTRLDAVDAGFDQRGLLLFRIDATSAGYAASSARRRCTSRSASGSRRCRASRGVPTRRSRCSSRTRQNKSFLLPDAPASGPRPVVNTNGVAANFFAAMGLPILRGRAFTDGRSRGDAEGRRGERDLRAPAVRRREPIGRRSPSATSPANDVVEIVGVARDAKYTDLRGRRRRRSTCRRCSASTARGLRGARRRGSGGADAGGAGGDPGPRPDAAGAQSPHPGRADCPPARERAALRPAVRVLRPDRRGAGGGRPARPAVAGGAAADRRVRPAARGRGDAGQRRRDDCARGRAAGRNRRGRRTGRRRAPGADRHGDAVRHHRDRSADLWRRCGAGARDRRRRLADRRAPGQPRGAARRAYVPTASRSSTRHRRAK